MNHDQPTTLSPLELAKQRLEQKKAAAEAAAAENARKEGLVTRIKAALGDRLQTSNKNKSDADSVGSVMGTFQEMLAARENEDAKEAISLKNAEIDELSEDLAAEGEDVGAIRAAETDIIENARKKSVEKINTGMLEDIKAASKHVGEEASNNSALEESLLASAHKLTESEHDELADALKAGGPEALKKFHANREQRARAVAEANAGGSKMGSEKGVAQERILTKEELVSEKKAVEDAIESFRKYTGSQEMFNIGYEIKKDLDTIVRDIEKFNPVEKGLSDAKYTEAMKAVGQKAVEKVEADPTMREKMLAAAKVDAEYAQLREGVLQKIDAYNKKVNEYSVSIGDSKTKQIDAMGGMSVFEAGEFAKKESIPMQGLNLQTYDSPLSLGAGATAEKVVVEHFRRLASVKSESKIDEDEEPEEYTGQKEDKKAEVALGIYIKSLTPEEVQKIKDADPNTLNAEFAKAKHDAYLQDYKVYEKKYGEIVDAVRTLLEKNEDIINLRQNLLSVSYDRNNELAYLKRRAEKAKGSEEGGRLEEQYWKMFDSVVEANEKDTQAFIAAIKTTPEGKAMASQISDGLVAVNNYIKKMNDVWFKERAAAILRNKGDIKLHYMDRFNNLEAPTGVYDRDTPMTSKAHHINRIVSRLFGRPEEWGLNRPV